MKKILFFSLMTVCLFSFGKCDKKKNCCKKKITAETAAKPDADEVWMRYDETKCENPWQFNWFQKPTEEQILGAVKSDLLGKGINILDIKSTNEVNSISCDACTCPNGRHFFVRVNKSETEKLKQMKFYEIMSAPEVKSDTMTK